MSKEYSLYTERKLLIDKLPLEAPLGVHICASSFCNFQCFYCNHSIDTLDGETGKVGTSGWLKRGFMDLDLYKTIIEQLKEFGGKIDTLNFAWLGEPLMNPNIAEMVKIAKDAGVAHTVSIVTNGSLLTHELSDKLIDAGLDRLRISLQGLSDKDYYGVSKYRLDYDKFVENIAYFYKNKKDALVYIKIMDEMLKSSDDEALFQSKYGDICDVLNIEHLVPINNVNGVKDKKKDFNEGYFGNEIRDTNICSYPFYMIVISPFGDCCCCSSAESVEGDSGLQNMVLSNVKSEPLKQYWEGKVLSEFRQKMITKGYLGCHAVCSKCNMPMYHTADSDYLDDYVDRLREIYCGD